MRAIIKSITTTVQSWGSAGQGIGALVARAELVIYEYDGDINNVIIQFSHCRVLR